MGNSQSMPVSEKLSYPAISPVPLVSMAKRPGRSQLDSSFSQSNRSGRSNYINIESYTNSREVINCGQDVGRSSSTLNQIEQHQSFDQNTYHERGRLQSSLSDHQPLQHQRQTYVSDTHTSHSCLQHTWSSPIRRDNLLNHQHRVQNMKETRTHNSMDSCNDCKSQGDNSEINIPQRSTSNCDLVQNNFKKSVPVELIHQLSVTESTLGEMTEADFGPELLYHEFDEDTLMERGGSFKPQACKPEHTQVTKDKTVHVREEDSKSKNQSAHHEAVCNYSNGSDFGSFCPSSTTFMSKRNETVDGPGAEQFFQVYVHPRTGEYHSLAFGSINGEGAFKNDSARMVSGTFEVLPSDSDNCITGSFSNFSSVEGVYESNSDFKPDISGVFVGKGGLLNSFSNSERSLSLVQNLDKGHSEISYNHETGNQSNQSQEKLQCPETGMDTSDTCPQFQVTPEVNLNTSDICQQFQVNPKGAFSNCETCDTVNLRLVPSFGSHDSVCQFCINLAQSLAAESEPFSATPSFASKSQHSHDSWCPSHPGAAFMPTTGTCFVDYSNDCHDLCNSSESSGQLSHTNHDLSGGEDMKVDECEICTEDFGLGIKPQSPHCKLSFGGMCSGRCRNILESQLLAESEIRGADTGEFNENNGSSRVLTSSLEEKCSPRQKHSSLLLPVNVNKQYRKNCEDDRDYKQEENIKSRQLSKHAKQLARPDLTVQSESDTSQSFPPNNRRDRCQNGARLQEPDQDWQVSSEGESSSVQVEEEEREFRLQLRMLQRSGSLPCGLGDPFRHNYSAYLCCAPDDLIPFGLSFHRKLEHWGFRIFIAPRDLELTGPKYDNMARWLEERCNGKIIVVLSKNYGMSDECLFLTYFARTLDPDSKYRNIIPVMIDKDVEIPNVLRGLSIIKYNYDFRCGWLKPKLINAISA